MKAVTGRQSNVAVGYGRVSTVRQAEHQASLEDQETSIRNFCAAEKLEFLEMYNEGAGSGTNDRRPVLVRLMQLIEAGGSGIGYLVVHSYSRFFRDAFELESHRRRLKRHGVKLVSITQQLDEADPMAAMTLSILAGFDQYQSREATKHTTRTMKLSAKQGFWNGARPPFGYRSVVAERRDDKLKKRLEIEEGEAAIVVKIFDLLLRGDGTSGSMGIRKIVDWLNLRGVPHRNGRWFVATVHHVLAETAYVGRYEWNKRSKGQLLPLDQRITIETPRIISDEDFAASATQRSSRRLVVTSPSVTTNPNLLTGLATCGNPGCGKGLTVVTGRSGQYVITPARGGLLQVSMPVPAFAYPVTSSIRSSWMRFSHASCSPRA